MRSTEVTVKIDALRFVSIFGSSAFGAMREKQVLFSHTSRTFFVIEGSYAFETNCANATGIESFVANEINYFGLIATESLGEIQLFALLMLQLAGGDRQVLRSSDYSFIQSCGKVKTSGLEIDGLAVLL